MNGVIPEGKINIVGNIPFNFQKGEKMVWIFNPCTYYQQTTHTTYQGGSQGVNIKVLKGVYYHVGQFKGNPVQTTNMELIANGVSCITDKNIYFASGPKSFRIPYKNLVTIQQYSDGIGFQEDKASSKPKAFGNIDGWFAYNLVHNLSLR